MTIANSSKHRRYHNDYYLNFKTFLLKEHLVIKADLPGLKQKDVNVSVDEGVLKIKGEKMNENEVKEKDYYRLERVSGSFERSLALPKNVDTAKIKATFKDGVLELILPKKEESKPKQIKVEVN